MRKINRAINAYKEAQRELAAVVAELAERTGGVGSGGQHVTRQFGNVIANVAVVGQNWCVAKVGNRHELPFSFTVKNMEELDALVQDMDDMSTAYEQAGDWAKSVLWEIENEQG